MDLGESMADRPPVPGRDGHEVVQRLVVDLPEPGRHRLHRLAPAVQHQSTQVARSASALIGARQRLKDVVREGLQAPADGGQLARCDAPTLPSLLDWRADPLTRHPSGANLTEHY